MRKYNVCVSLVIGAVWSEEPLSGLEIQQLRAKIAAQIGNEGAENLHDVRIEPAEASTAEPAETGCQLAARRN